MWGIGDDAIITPGSHVLELGCGQGTATTVLAEAVGSAGHVDAVDPGAPDYGAPFTLAEAQVSEQLFTWLASFFFFQKRRGRKGLL